MAGDSVGSMFEVNPPVGSNLPSSRSRGCGEKVGGRELEGSALETPQLRKMEVLSLEEAHFNYFTWSDQVCQALEVVVEKCVDAVLCLQLDDAIRAPRKSVGTAASVNSKSA